MSSEPPSAGSDPIVGDGERPRRPRSVPAATPEVRDLVDRYQRQVNRAALLAIPRREPQHYHYSVMAEYPLRRGKGLRPALCLASCQAHGGRAADALPVAVSLELLHNAFLVHDDVQDASPLRRGAPSLHERHGHALAINVGDGLAALSASHLHAHVAELGPSRAAAVLGAFDDMLRETLEGQAMDIGWRRDNRLDVTTTDYLAMVTKKTGWYTVIQPIRLGAMTARPSAAANPAFVRFGVAMGAFFQLANDVAGATAGPPGGQVEAEDLYEGKRSLPVLHLAGQLPNADRKRLEKVLARPREERSSRDVAWLAKRLDAAGSIDYARSCVWAMAEVAQQQAEEAFGGLAPGPDRDLLLGAVGYVADLVE